MIKCVQGTAYVSLSIVIDIIVIVVAIKEWVLGQKDEAL